MGKKKESEQAAELTKEQRVVELEAEIQRHVDNAETFRVQLQELKNGKIAFDQDRQDRIDRLLDSYPDHSARGLLDKILKSQDAKSTQLTGNIEKVQVAIEVEQRKANKARLEKKQLEKEIADKLFDDQASAVFQNLNLFIESAQKTESTFETLKDSIRACGDPLFFTRAKKLGYPVSYEVICNSHLKRETLDTLGTREVLERVANLGNTYGPPLLKKELNRQDNQPLVRDAFYSYGFNQN